MEYPELERPMDNELTLSPTKEVMRSNVLLGIVTYIQISIAQKQLNLPLYYYGNNVALKALLS